MIFASTGRHLTNYFPAIPYRKSSRRKSSKAAVGQTRFAKFRFICFFSLFCLIASVQSYAVAAIPSLSLTLNASIFTRDSALQLSIAATPGVPAVADAYIALRLPDGSLFFMQPDHTFSPNAIPVFANVVVPVLTLTPFFNYRFIGGEQAGVYTWYVALTQPSTQNVIGQIASGSFQFYSVLPRTSPPLPARSPAQPDIPPVLPTLSVANASVLEGNVGTTNLNFTVTLSAASASAVTVNYATSDGTALAASDYTAANGILTIPTGATTGTVSVPISGDTMVEPDETLMLTLSTPVNATITTVVATGTITNDDWVWIYNSPAGIAMVNAGFVYVPGGWDVNGDGVVESGFWLSKYQASATATPAVIHANLIDYLAGTVANTYADGMQVYNPATKQFDQTLCTDGTDVTPGVTPAGCRHNNYIKTGNAAIAVNRVRFVNSAVPLVNESPVEAMAAIADSQIAGGVPISLPSELQWMQVVQLLINNPASWSNGVVNAGGGFLWRGNSNGVSALAANNLGATDTTENATFDVNRRTWLLTNGVMANDSAVPATYCAATNADASANGSLESVNAATEAKCTVWDMAGNVWQWTRGLIAANAATSSTGVRAGGDRFIDGQSGLQQYSNVILQANAPAWWIPKLVNGTVLTSAQNAGIYFDGQSQTGTWDSVNIGYGAGVFVSGFAAVFRGGNNGTTAGLATAQMVFGPGFRASSFGFRASSL